jgi:hypothetical protein
MKPLPVPIHLQDDFKSCGNACAQMIMKFLDQGTPPRLQNSFVPTSPTRVPWHTTPDQLCDMLNQFRPAGVPAYAVTIAADAVAAMEVAIANVDNTNGPRCPVVALTSFGSHWEVVHGFTKDGGSTNPIVHARNPLPDRTLLFPNPPHASGPPPHTDTDTCAVQNIVSAGSATPADEVVAWTTWLSTYFTACGINTPPWKNHFVVVAPALPRARRVAPPHAIPGRTPPVPDTPLISGTRASDSAVKWITSSELVKQGAWSESVQGLSIDVEYRSVLVHRLDDQEPFYLVALTTDRNLGVLVGVSAHDGAFQFSRLNPPRELVDGLFTLDEVRTAFDSAGRNSVRLVWAPVKETFFSPYFPLVEFTTPDGARSYVRIYDRQRFEAVTLPGSSGSTGA